MPFFEGLLYVLGEMKAFCVGFTIHLELARQKYQK